MRAPHVSTPTLENFIFTLLFPLQKQKLGGDELRSAEYLRGVLVTTHNPAKVKEAMKELTELIMKSITELKLSAESGHQSTEMVNNDGSSHERATEKTEKESVEKEKVVGGTDEGETREGETNEGEREKDSGEKNDFQKELEEELRGPTTMEGLNKRDFIFVEIARAVGFLRFPLNPRLRPSRILKHIFETVEKPPTLVIRAIPIDYTTRGTMKHFERLAAQVVDHHFPHNKRPDPNAVTEGEAKETETRETETRETRETETRDWSGWYEGDEGDLVEKGSSWCVEWNARNNSNIPRMPAINVLGGMVSSHPVKLENSDYSLLTEVNPVSVCICVSVCVSKCVE